MQQSNSAEPTNPAKNFANTSAIKLETSSKPAQLACFGLGEAHFPLWHLRPAEGDDKATEKRKVQQARSLLFVTATRARDRLELIYSGAPSPLVKSLKE